MADGRLEVPWMTQNPAPDSILDLACNCKKNKCQTENCVCVSQGLKCIDIFGYTNCENKVEEGAEDDDEDCNAFCSIRKTHSVGSYAFSKR